MSIEQVLKDAKDLTSSEKALLARCLIASLESANEQGVDEAWALLAQKRFEELDSGRVTGMAWSEIKSQITE